MMTTNDMIAALASGRPDERIRVMFQPKNNVMGYAIEIIRELAGADYVYIGWVDAKVVRENTKPWALNQKIMCDNAFKAAINEVTI